MSLYLQHISGKSLLETKLMYSVNMKIKNQKKKKNPKRFSLIPFSLQNLDVGSLLVDSEQNYILELANVC